MALKFVKFALCCILCFCISSCASTRIQSMDTSEKFEIYDDEARLWKRSEEGQEILNKSGFIYKNDELTQYVNNILHKLVGDFERANNVELKAYILKDPLFNAFCWPNGVIYLHTGIIANAENEAQLATILGHEASHFLCRDSLKQHRSQINKSAFLTVFDMTLGSLTYALGGTSTSYGSSADLLRLLGDYVVIGSVFGYSRDIEREADKNAFEFMKKAGYNPLEGKKFFENMYKATKEEKDKVPYFYHSHPRTKERIKTYASLIKNLSKETDGEITGIENSEIYNKITKNVLLDNAELDMKRKNGLKSAKRQIEKYNRLYPDNARAYCLLGKLLILEDNKEEAKKALSRSVELNQDYAESYRDLGLLYYKNGEKEIAASNFKKYLQLKPKSKDADYIRGYLNE